MSQLKGENMCKKIIAYLLTAVLAFTICVCGGNALAEQSAAEDVNQPAQCSAAQGKGRQMVSVGTVSPRRYPQT